jgi:hypothetical protein
MGVNGSEKEEDPRKTRSLPSSPSGDFQFDRDAHLRNNVYAESKPANPLGKIGKSYADADT